MAKITLQNGSSLNVPDGLSPDQMDEVVESYHADMGANTPTIQNGVVMPPSSEPDFMGRMKQDMASRANEDQRTRALADSGKISYTAHRIGELGQGAGYVLNDLPANLVGSAARSVYHFVAPSEEQRGVLGDALDRLSGRNLPQAPEDPSWLAQGAQYMEQNHPATSTIAGAVGNAIQLFPVAGALGDVGKLGAGLTRESGNILQKIGGGIRASGEASDLARNTKAAEALIAPKLTGKAAVEAGKNAYNDGGILGNVGVEQSGRQAAQVQNLLDAGVTRSDDAVGAIGKVQNAYESEAQSLLGKLESSGVKYSGHIDDIGTGSVNEMLENPNLIQLGNDGETIILNPQARMVANKASAIMKENAGTPAGLLKARQQLDKWARTVKSGVFEKDSILGDAITSVRNNMNNYIKESVPDVGVADSLAKQSALIGAETQIAPKSAKLIGTNRFSRLATAVTGATTPLGAATRAGVGTAAAIGVPLATGASVVPLAAGAGLAYGGYKAAASPLTRKLIGSGIESLGKGASYIGDAALGAKEIAPTSNIAGLLTAPTYIVSPEGQAGTAADRAILGEGYKVGNPTLQDLLNMPPSEANSWLSSMMNHRTLKR